MDLHAVLVDPNPSARGRAAWEQNIIGDATELTGMANSIYGGSMPEE